MNEARVATLAAICAMIAVAAQVGGKALRDALFLSEFPVSTLPAVVTASALATVVVVLWATPALMRLGPRRLTAGLFTVSAVAVAGQSLLHATYPKIVAIWFYLHLATFGALLISGLWSAVTEAFNPAAARRRVGTVATGATIGGVIGGLVAERVAAWATPSTMFTLIAGGQVICALLIGGLRPIERSDPDHTPVAESIRRLAADGYLLRLGALVVLATTVENVLDYLLKARAAAALTDAELMQFFGVFYTVIGIVALILQVGLSGRMLRRFGPALTAVALPITAFVTGVAVLVGPSLVSTTVARGGYATVRNSLFRSGYELFFAPLSAERRRSAKTLVDVGSDRCGDLVGSLFILAVVFAVPGDPEWILALSAVGLTLMLATMVWELRRGYVRVLETQLIDRGSELALTQTVLRSGLWQQGLQSLVDVRVDTEDAAKPAPQTEGDPDPLTTADVVALLDDPARAARAFETLQADLDAHAQGLCEALSDRETPYNARRRIPALLRGLPARDAQDALIVGLDDPRFEVRFRCGEVLYEHVREGQPPNVSGTDVWLGRELRVSKKVWAARRIVASRDGEADQALDAKLGARVDRSLQHVFHLLSFEHPVRPLRVAFRSLHTDDEILRGTALEYLASILPERSFRRLALMVGEADAACDGPPERALESLLASQVSVELNLDRHS